MEMGPIKIMQYWWKEQKDLLLLFCSLFVCLFCFVLFLRGVLGPILLSPQCRAGLHELSIWKVLNAVMGVREKKHH